ncbi:hypothetical protein JCM17380_41010 [Desulfosporosinus burensis]
MLIVTIDPGFNKPYQDNTGAFWVISGADKRKVTSREEIQRMFQIITSPNALFVVVTIPR